MAKRTPSGSPSQADDGAAAAPAARRSRRSRASVAGDAAAQESMSASAAVATGVEDAGEGAPSQDDIRLRAYHRYLERGGGHGMDFQDWLEAERELRGRK